MTCLCNLWVLPFSCSLFLSSTLTNYFILSMERRRQIDKSPRWELMGGRMEEEPEKVQAKIAKRGSLNFISDLFLFKCFFVTMFGLSI